MDLNTVVEIAMVTAISAFAYFFKQEKETTKLQLEELTNESKKLRESIFTMTLQQETRRLEYQTIFVKQETVQRIWSKIDELYAKVIALETVVYKHGGGIINATHSSTAS